jgi:MFS family permease
MSPLPRAVWLFGWISLATDAATEAIYPLLPFFLTRVLGAGALSLGVVEGAAEAVSSALKIASGRLADRSRSKRPIVLFGYSVSSIARPFIAITTTWPQVFAIRVLDRVGKGVRSAPRDAMLATWTTPDTRGRVYGFHRAMDHLGAVVGPTLASGYLWFYPEHYRTLFALTIVPGAIAVLLIFFVPEEVRVRLKADATTPKQQDPAGVARVRLKADATTPKPRDPTGVVSGFSRTADKQTSAVLPPEFTRFMFVLALFTLGNSTDAFLLLRLTDVAGSAKWIPLTWAALHVVKAGVSTAGGSWSDRIGRRKVIAMGWIVYAAVYAGFAVSTKLPALLAWFLVYGFYFGFAEGTEKALVADLAPAERRGFAFGIYNAVQGLGALAASVIFGVIWKTCGAPAAFWTGAAFALGATALLFVFVRPYNRQHT